MSSHATLGAAADERKARLARLRSIKRKQPDDEVVAPESDRASPAIPRSEEEGGNTADRKHLVSGDDSTATPDVTRLHLSGRNYDPETRGAKLGFEAPPNLAVGEATLEAKAAELEAEIRRQEEEDGGDDDDEANPGSTKEQQRQIDLFKLQPKKPNWDLKRALNKRLEPLNVRTDNAIARLVRQRLQAKQQGTLHTIEQAAPQNAGKGGAGKRGDVGEDEENGESALEGAALVEGLRLREQEAEEEERREREAEEEEGES